MVALDIARHYLKTGELPCPLTKRELLKALVAIAEREEKRFDAKKDQWIKRRLNNGRPRKTRTTRDGGLLQESASRELW